jgi:hypothetical protein
MKDNDDIAVTVQQRLRHAEQFDRFLQDLTELIEGYQGASANGNPRPAQRRKHRSGPKKGTKRRMVTPAEVKRIIKLRKAKVPYQKIADRLGRAPSVVRNVWAREQG